TRRGPLAPYKSLGVVLYRDPTQEPLDDAYADTIMSAWTGALTLSNRPALMNLRMFSWGTVELEEINTSSVRYHFGYDATEQGLGTVTPNPVRENASVPFSLTELAQVTIDLFDVNGQLVKNMVQDKKFIPGKYSIDLPVDELANGAYVL